MKQEVAGDLKENRDQILSTFEANNYKLVKDEDGEMIFSNNNLLKRITFLFEDKISVSQVGDKLVVEGIRRAVPFIIYRLEGAISFSDDNK